ncbi:FAD:protein FMN transferase [Pseudonocardia xishanensis]|uniref:FAD:protein FMN transferase n=1 Tax=Pseudonocardia xishanensis TaxID=630995 RepID=A0ABP8RTB7_9PSEU
MTATVAGPRPARYVEQIMGMPVSLALRGSHTDDDLARVAWRRVCASLRSADRVFSTYRRDSAVSRLDRGELALADCPPEVGEVLALGEAARRDSGGAFDVRRRGGLDPSGVVKGWAVERAAAALAALPDTDFCLSAGGDLTCRTLHPHDPPWRIGVEDPHDPGGLVAVVPIHTGAVATSGTARRGPHVVDARTGLAPVGLASVTVVGDSLTAVDIAATAAFALGAAAAGIWLADRGHRGLLVDTDGTLRPVGPEKKGRTT